MNIIFWPGWWLNLVYLNNFGKDITGKTGYDCVNVSWYMAIDMQYFVLSPILLTIYWRKPIAGDSFGLIFSSLSILRSPDNPALVGRWHGVSDLLHHR